MGFIHPISELLQWKTSFSCNINEINHTKYLGVFFGLSSSDSMEMPYINAENKYCSWRVSKDLPSGEEVLSVSLLSDVLSDSHCTHVMQAEAGPCPGLQGTGTVTKDQGPVCRPSLQCFLPMPFCVQRGSHY